MIRIGHGFDAHRFVDGVPLVLGGVRIPHTQGLAAHSDGDVVIHALCDALLGAAALGDIGNHFPDTSDEYKDIDSRILLRKVKVRLEEAGYRLLNADITIVAESPRLSAHAEDMRNNLATDLAVPAGFLNIKATTTEGMGCTGRGEGIATFAVVLLDASA